ncbi:MAG: DctP family TRAP transporter solute-binding subunit [Clostridiales bacterium]|nr:DctP family TRAP transporter solute-binding subunit [Clostridiales bacterium]
MKKRVIALGLVLAMAAATTACGGSSADTSAPAPAEKTETESTESADGAAETGESTGAVEGDFAELTLFAASIPENTPTGVGLQAMADYITENSNGTMEAVTYYDTALGDASSLTEALKMGTVDIGVSGTAYFSSLVPEIEVFQLPFLFEDLESARAATSGPAADEINAMFDSVGIVGLSFWENGFRELSNNKRNVATPADMDGIKMRTLGSPIQIQTWSAFGAMTTQIDASELYTSLAQGTIDAQDNPLHEIVARKLYEVQPYVTMTDATYTPFYMAMSKVRWDSLSESQRALVVEAAEVGRQAQLDATDEAQATAKQTLLDNGVTIEENPDKAAFQEIAKPLWKVFTDVSPKAAELLETVQAGM